MRIVRRPVRPVSRQRRNRYDGALVYGTTGMFPRRDAGEMTAMTSGATWMPHDADLTRPNEPNDHRAQMAHYRSLLATAHTSGRHLTSTHLSLDRPLNNMTTAGWPAHTIAARFSHLPARPNLQTASPRPHIDLTRLLRDPTRSPHTIPTRQLLQLTPSASQTGPQRGVAKSGTPFGQPPTSRTAPRSVLSSSLLVCVRSS